MLDNQWSHSGHWTYNEINDLAIDMGKRIQTMISPQSEIQCKPYSWNIEWRKYNAISIYMYMGKTGSHHIWGKYSANKDLRIDEQNTMKTDHWQYPNSVENTMLTMISP